MNDWTMSEKEASEFAELLKIPTEREVKNVSLQFTARQWQVLSRLAGPELTVRKWIMGLVGVEVQRIARLMMQASTSAEESKAP